jgi:osmotically-inducible protein OsmY
MKRSIISVLVALSVASASMSVSAKNTWEDTAKDAWIDGKVESTLLFNTNLNSFDINTDVKKGVVTLTGKVESMVDKALAEELALSLKGVSEVNNELTVMENEDDDGDDNDDMEVMDKMKDSKIEAVVKTRLLFESQVSGFNIEVEVKSGQVTLSGNVSSDAERDLAAAIAKNTNDVKKVVNNLQISS